MCMYDGSNRHVSMACYIYTSNRLCHCMLQAQAKASPRRPITEVDNEKLKSLNDELKSSKEAVVRITDEFHQYKKSQSQNER